MPQKKYTRDETVRVEEYLPVIALLYLMLFIADLPYFVGNVQIQFLAH